MQNVLSSAYNYCKNSVSWVYEKAKSFGPRKTEITPSPVSSIEAGNTAAPANPPADTQLTERAVTPEPEPKNPARFISKGYLLAEKLSKSFAPAHRVKGLNIKSQQVKRTDTGDPTADFALNNVSVLPLTGEQVVRVEENTRVKLQPLSPLELMRLRRGIGRINRSSPQTFKIPELDRAAQKMTRHLSGQDSTLTLKDIDTTRQKITTLQERSGLLPALQRQAVQNYCQVLSDLCDAALSILHIERREQVPPFQPGGSYFKAVCFRHQIEPADLLKRIDINSLNDYRSRLRMKAYDSGLASKEEFHRALIDEMLIFFEFALQQLNRDPSTGDKFNSLTKQLDRLYNPETEPEALNTAIPFTPSDTALPALNRTGIKNTYHIKVSGRTTATLECEKADLHRGIVQHVISHWQHRNARIDQQIQQHNNQFNELISSPLTGPELSKALSDHTLRQKELEDLRAQVDFPDPPSVNLHTADNQPGDLACFKSPDAESQERALHLQKTTPEAELQIEQQLLKTPAFSDDASELTEFKTFMSGLMQQCCLLEPENHSRQPFSQQHQQQQQLLITGQQLKTAITALAQREETTASTAALHYLRIQEAVLERYLEKSQNSASNR